MNTTFTPPRLNAAATISKPATLLPRQRWIRRVGAALWRALEAIGQARAQPHLLAFAARCEAQHPALAQELRAAARCGPLA